jgi:starvation-inducible DNA-binding protein
MDNHTIVAELHPLLVELTDIALTGKQAHWNLRGPLFRPLHLQLDDLVADARTWADEVAERIVALDVPADARVETVATLTPFAAFYPGFVEDSKVVCAMVERLDDVVGRLRPRLSRLGETDLISQDLLIGIAAGLEKHRWMFSAEQA